MTEPNPAGTWPPAGHSTPGQPAVALPEPPRDHSDERVEPGVGGFDLAVSVTGQPGVDAALARLGELGAHPTADHVEIYQRVHADLHEVLSELDGNQS